MHYKQPSDWYFGLCMAIQDASEELGMDQLSSPFATLDMYPEIFKHKPNIKYNDYFWFNYTSKGTQKRIDILKQAIQETL